jgi:hypothetical protein
VSGGGRGVRVVWELVAPDGGATAPRPRRAAAGVSGGERGVRVEKKWAMEDGYIWRKYE